METRDIDRDPDGNGVDRRDFLSLLLDELGAIGFDHLTERSSYADAAALFD